MVHPLAAMRSQWVVCAEGGLPDGAGENLVGEVEVGEAAVVADVEGVELRVGAWGGSALAEVDGFGPGPTGAELEAAAEAATGFED